MDIENGGLTTALFTPGDAQALTTVLGAAGTSTFLATKPYEEEIEEKQPDGSIKTTTKRRRKLDGKRVLTSSGISTASLVASEAHGAELTPEQYAGIDNQRTVLESFVSDSDNEQDQTIELLLAKIQAQEKAEVAELAPMEETAVETPKQLIRK